MSVGSTLQNISHTVVLYSGWRASILAFALGALTATGQAPLYWFPVLWLTFPVLVLLIDGAAPAAHRTGFRRLMPAFWRGYMFGFGYFVAGLWWLGSAFLVNAEQFAWLMPLAVVGLPLALAFFFGFATLIARAFWQDGPSRIFVLAAGLAVFEWLRATILTGFPWNSLGYLLAPNDVMMQAIALFGVDIYALFAVIIFASPVIFLDATSDGSPSNKGVVFVAAAGLIALVGFGTFRLLTAEKNYVDGVQMRIIQPNIAQREKFLPGKADEILDRYLSMSVRSTKPGDLGLLSTTHLIWPESAFPFLLTEKPDAIAAIADMLPTGTTLVTGAVRADPRQAGKDRKFYNSLYVIDHNGEIKDAYDKVHLVPFGEYLPFENILESIGLLALVEVPGGFSSGSKRIPISAGGAPSFLPLICYEIIFPSQMGPNDSSKEAQWILNVTNDAWFGLTSGPYQHFHQTRIRAVEEGMAVVRAANNGISGVIDAYGRVDQSGRLGEPDIIDARLPSKVDLPAISVFKSELFWLISILIFIVSIKSVLSRRQ